MIEKIIKLEFANWRLHTQDRYTDIYHAVKSAQKNLWCRHDILLSDPFVGVDGIYVRLKIPDEKETESLSIGRRLRGISKYLLQKDVYKIHREGTRLLNFYDVTDTFEKW